MLNSHSPDVNYTYDDYDGDFSEWSEYTPLGCSHDDVYYPLCDDTLPLDVAVRLMSKGYILEGVWS